MIAAAIAFAGVLPASASAASANTTKYRAADKAVVSAAQSLSRCQVRTNSTSPKVCKTERNALQKAGLKLSKLQGSLARSAASNASTLAPTQVAPVLSATGAKLTWKKVAGVNTYVLVRKVSGRSDLYSAVTGTTVTPDTIAGKTVTYSVRTAVVGSAWARELQVKYATAAQRQAAPALSVDGKSLRWTSVVGVDSYVLVTKEPGAADVYETVTGTSVTPPAKAGKTVRYSVRTNVNGAAWAREVSIGFPAASTGTTTTAPSTTTTQPGAGTPSTGNGSSTAGTTTSGSTTSNSSAPAPAAPSTTSNFEMGMNSGSAIAWEMGFITKLSAKHVRMEFDINTNVSDIAPIVLQYAQAGIQPMLLAGFQGRTPTATEAQNLATWAAAFGPGGTFWQGKNVAPSTAVTRIEFGNETNNPYQYNGWTLADDWYKNSQYLNLAKEYARQAKNAAIAVTAANPKVGILAVGDQYSGYTTWINAMFDAVPDLANYVAGWTVHPYGPQWQIPMDNMLAAMKARGAAEKPLYVTEWGVSSDNGRCLSDNFGYDKCMSYTTAANTLKTVVAGMRARYGARLASVFLYSTADQRSTGASTDREHYFGAMKSDNTPKGAYTDEVVSLMTTGV
ncbi:hypothetical protein [Baekduia sp. Peel2402]|uniref:hypothetical protein n=1 Tax=Baekduia sp. Peel2402 TaxID=3458296 RepID=UPI00403EC747